MKICTSLGSLACMLISVQWNVLNTTNQMEIKKSERINSMKSIILQTKLDQVMVRATMGKLQGRFFTSIKQRHVSLASKKV